MKVLSIGNSFSQDAQHWLHQVAACEGTEIECYNLFVGGCSLQRHWENWCVGERAYVLEKNGIPLRNSEDTDSLHVSIQDALDMCAWDVITFQQASGLSGMYETYQPYLNDLASAVRAQCPKAKCYMHQTWAYDTHYEGQQFAAYHFHQDEMYHCLKRAYKQAAKELGVALIPCGDVIQALRQTNTFHVVTGISLNRDGSHISYTLGRYALAVTWYTALIGQVPKCDFVPPESVAEDVQHRALIRSTVADLAALAQEEDVQWDRPVQKARKTCRPFRG